MSRIVTRHVTLCPVNAEKRRSIIGRNGIRKTERARAMTNKTNHCVTRNSYSCFTEYENQTIQHYADKLIRENGIPEHQRDDILQELAINLWESLSHFDSEKADRNTFACIVVQQKFVDMLRKHYSPKEKFHRAMLSLNVDITCDDENIEAIQTIPDQSPQVSPELKCDINSAIELLNPELREMCLALKRMSLYEYCRLYHVSRFTANRRLEKIRIVFRKFF